LVALWLGGQPIHSLNHQGTNQAHHALSAVAVPTVLRHRSADRAVIAATLDLDVLANLAALGNLAGHMIGPATAAATVSRLRHHAVVGLHEAKRVTIEGLIHLGLTSSWKPSIMTMTE
jgi:hypothetical protein